MPVSEARSFARPRDVLIIEPVRPDEGIKALRKLALRLERYSFCIGMEEGDRPECLLMDITGVAPLFVGERPLAEHLERKLSKWRLEGRVAIGDSIGSAWAASRFLARPLSPIVISPDDQRALWDLPVEGLRLDSTAIAKLRRLGITTIDQLFDLDRASLLPRLGLDLLLRLDQFIGAREESITPCRPTPQFRVERRLDEGMGHPAAIEQLWSLLLGELLEMLQSRRLGTRHLECRFHLEDRAPRNITLRLCEASHDHRHLSDLLRLQLEGLKWEALLVGLRMEASDIVPLESSQHELFAGKSRDQARRLSLLLNRLSGRLGHKAVVRPELLPQVVPERAARLVPVTESGLATSTTFHETLLPLDRPLALFDQPKPIEVIAVMPDGPPAVVFWKGTRLDIAQCWGPERIESGWWQDGYVRRDYYWVEATEGRRFWLFRRSQNERWFLHGEMM